MDLEKIEELIDRAIEEGDFEKVLRLLDEREKVLKNVEIDEETAKELMEKDKKRVEKIESMKKELLQSVFKSRRFTDQLRAYQRGEKGRSWGKG